MAFATPLPYPPIERRQIINSIGDAISSVLDDNGGSSSGSGSSGSGSGSSGGSSGDNSGTSNGGSGGTTGATATGTITGQTSATSATSSATGTTQATSARVTQATSATAAAGESVVTQVSTINGGNTVVIIRTTAGSATPTSSASDNNSSSSSSSSNGGLIGGVVGGVVGGLALLTAIILIFILWRRRRSRTGHGWFLCFGRKPKSSKDYDVDWPTFDPTAGAAGVGGTMGSRSGHGSGAYATHGGTLPEVDDNEAAYGNADDMRELNSGGHSSYNNYYGGAAAAAAAGGAAASGPRSSSYKLPSEEGHLRNGGWAASSVGAPGTVNDEAHSPVDSSVPTYDHLDPPEVREARAREQAEAQAQAMAAYNNSNGGGSPPMYQPSAYYPYNGGGSPPPPSTSPQQQRPLSDHRLSTGTTQALAANNYFADEADPEEGSVRPGQQHTLHLHNPDA